MAYRQCWCTLSDEAVVLLEEEDALWLAGADLWVGADFPPEGAFLSGAASGLRDLGL